MPRGDLFNTTMAAKEFRQEIDACRREAAVWRIPPERMALIDEATRACEQMYRALEAARAWEPATSSASCPACGGSRKVSGPIHGDPDTLLVDATCLACLSNFEAGAAG